MFGFWSYQNHLREIWISLSSLWYIIQIPTMKVLQVIQSYFRIFGIQPPNSNGAHRFNIRSFGALFIILLFLLSASSFLVRDAKTIREFTESIYLTTTALVNCAFFLLCFTNGPDFFRFVTNTEQAISNREFLSMQKEKSWINQSKCIFLATFSDEMSIQLHNKVNEQVNKWTQLVHTFMVKCSIPIGGFPIIIFSYYTYYTTDLGAESFLLPICMK